MRRILLVFTAAILTMGAVIEISTEEVMPEDHPESSSIPDPIFPAWEPRSWTEEEFIRLMNLPEAAPMDYWIRLAQCETGQNWANEGRHGGGLGFFTVGNFPSPKMGGWERMGGEQFADHPSDASIVEQIIVAQRTGIHGWGPIPLERDPEMARRKGIPIHYAWETNPHGYWTWGCAKRVVGDPCGFLYDGTVIPDLPHERPDYCRFMKPVDYRKGESNGRYVHNRNQREAIERSRREGASSVAIEGAIAFLNPPPILQTPPPADALCPKAWQIAREVGFSEEEIEILDEIIHRESGCRHYEKKKAADGEILRGWTQIGGDWTSYLRAASVLWSAQDLLDPRTNLEAARALYLRGMRKHGWGWGPWGIDPPSS